MKYYFSLVIALTSILSSLTGNAAVVIKEVTEMPMGLYARMNSRQNDKGEDLAVVRLTLPSVQGISFQNNYGDVSEEIGEYILYLNPGTESLDILGNGELLSTINFKDWGIEIKPKSVYKVSLSMDQQNQVGFIIQPENARLTVNGRNIPLNSDGEALFEYEPGEIYEFQVTSDGYLPYEDTFFFGEDETDLEPIAVILDPQTTLVKINSNVAKMDVFSGNTFIATIKNGEAVELPTGPQKLRIVADKYKDWEYLYTVPEYSTSLDIKLTKIKESVGTKLKSRWGFYAGGGVGFGEKFDKESLLTYPIRIGVEYNYFITRNFTFRTEIEGFGYLGKKFQTEDSSGKKSTPLTLDLAFPFNLNLPLSKYNLHFFTLGVGPIVGITIFDTPASNEMSSVIMYGGRLEAKFYFNKFLIGATVDYQGFGKDKNKYTPINKGLWVPTVTLGYMFK